MKLISYIYKKAKSMFGQSGADIITDLETVLGERGTPRTDPNRGTAFWTSTHGGRLQQRIVYLGLIGILISGVFVHQLWKLQIDQGQAFAIESVQNTLDQTPIFSQRGTITDRRDIDLAWSTATSSQPYYMRTYASSTGLANLLGYVKYPRRDDNGNFYRDKVSGKAGVEKAFHNTLSGNVGTKIVETNALGEPVSESVVDQPKSGDDLKLSIDARVQEKLHSLIGQTAKDRGFSGGAGILMDVKTGELIAAASYPQYDSQALTDGESGYVQELIANKSQPFLNRVSSGRYTPGSIVKPFLAAAALAEDVITPRTTIVSTGMLRIENPYQPGMYSLFPDWKEHGPVTVRDALAVSSNEFFYQIGGGYEDQPGLGIDNIVSYSQDFGLGQKTGIDGMNEVAGVIPSPEWKAENFADDIWRLGDTYHTAIGQYGYQVTPLQVVRAVAGLATYGELPTPSLLKKANFNTSRVSRRISAEDYQVVHEGMRQAVTRGTAEGLDVDYLEVAAKTGTAELGGKESGLNSWIIGFFPYDDPQYAFTVVMAEGPRSNSVGGLYVMRQLLDWMERNDMQYVRPDAS